MHSQPLSSNSSQNRWVLSNQATAVGHPQSSLHSSLQTKSWQFSQTLHLPSKWPASPFHSPEWLFLISYYLHACFFFLSRIMLFLPRNNRKKHATDSHSFLLFSLSYSCFFCLFRCHNCPTDLLSSEQPCTHSCLLFFSVANLEPYFKIYFSFSDFKKLSISSFSALVSVTFHLNSLNKVLFGCSVRFATLGIGTHTVPLPGDSIWLYSSLGYHLVLWL